MDRRAFLGTMASGLLAAPLAVEAQPAGKMPKVGILIVGSAPDPLLEAFRRGLRDLGYTEDQNVVIAPRFAHGKPERYPALVGELLDLKVDVLVAGGGIAGARAATVATKTVPIVTPVMSDPVGSGVIVNLGHPGGNITGLSMLNTETTTKRLQLLREVFPNIARLAVLHDPRSEQAQLAVTETSAQRMGLQLQIFSALRPDEFETAFSMAKKARAEALPVLASGFFNAQRKRLVNLTVKYRIPAVYEHREFVDTGGLMSYGPTIAEMYRRAATYVDKILKGAKPGDLPVEQSTKFELVINLKTAKVLGLTIPQSLLLRADQVIE
jgi:putative ABC transport system substrate-binding protein